MDALGDGQARRLRDDVGAVCDTIDRAPTVALLEAHSKLDFFEILEVCTRLALEAQGNYVPLIHINCHGSEEGFEVCGEEISWQEVSKYFSALNFATRMNLIVVFSCCFGVYFAKSFSAIDGAPAWGFIGPSGVVDSGFLSDAFVVFYRNLLMLGSAAAIGSMRDELGGVLIFVSAESLFDMAMKKYREEHLSEVGIRAAALRNVQKLREIGVELNVGIDYVEERAEFISRKMYWEFCKKFFFLDDCEENYMRFDGLIAHMQVN